MQQVVTITNVFSESGNSKATGKPYTRYDIKTAGGTKFQTFDAALGAQAKSLEGASVEIEYEVESRGQYENNVLKSISAAAPPDYYGAGQSAPQAAVNTNDRELRIMRQSALDRAINTVGHGIVEIEGVKVTPDKINPYDLFRLADTYILYFEAGISAFTQPNEVPEEVVTY
jgi:hypothetical protein